MAGGDVGQILVQQVAVIVAYPQMMMRVDDRQAGIEDRLGRPLRQPRYVGREKYGRTVFGFCLPGIVVLPRFYADAWRVDL